MYGAIDGVCNIRQKLIGSTIRSVLRTYGCMNGCNRFTVVEKREKVDRVKELKIYAIQDGKTDCATKYLDDTTPRMMTSAIRRKSKDSFGLRSIDPRVGIN